MPIARFDQDMQIEILNILAENYPQFTKSNDLEENYAEELKKFDFNLWYLLDHGFVAIKVDNDFKHMWRATAKGIDQLRGGGDPI